MNGTSVIIFISIASIVSTLIMEGIKKAKTFTIGNNILIAIISMIVGWGGGIVYYILCDIPFANLKNITLLILFAPICWIGSMVGYDKVVQTVEQVVFDKLRKNIEKEKEIMEKIVNEKKEEDEEKKEN